MEFTLKGAMNEEKRAEKEIEYTVIAGIIWAFITFLSLAYSFAIQGFYPVFIVSELGVGIPFLVGKLLSEFYKESDA